MDYRRSTTNMTDATGALLFSTNNVRIGNATGSTMQNGTYLNPSYYTFSYPDGLHLSQGALFPPKPEHPDIYYLLHGTVDDMANSTAQYLYLTTIDMTFDGALGAVVTKNQILIEDTLNVGKITAVRHANGRDWWVFCHKAHTNVFHRLLITPQGVQVDGSQSIGITRSMDVGQVCFSPDGRRFAYYWGVEDLEIFSFDRCTGLFADPVHIPIDDTNTMGGVAFSPSGRYLYVSSVMDVYQFDTEATSIAASMVHIAHWDGFYSPSPPFATGFDIAQLAPDGKVYIATGNSTLHLHVVHDPDQPGFACNMEQHGVELPTYYTNSLPNHPNYHLGPVVGSVCDSLALTANSTLTPGEGPGVRVYPNPSNGQFNLSYPVQPEAGLLEVLDIQGRVVYHSRLAAWSQVHAVGLEGEAAGMYHCRLRWGAQAASTRIIITEP
ncbi:MAG: T9SS type A sorting domain-containing protein [Flavobacteriales bacterium]|nr:T9SS type A sorting domain-containing protein [Flavobacteriales bacterium]